MSGSSSGSDSGGKKKPPNTRKKKDRGLKVNLGALLKPLAEPTEKASKKGPNEEAKASRSGKETAVTAAPTRSATGVTAEDSAATVASTPAMSTAMTSAASNAAVPAASAAETKAANNAAAPAASAAKGPAAASSADPVASATSRAPKETPPRLSEVVRAASEAAPPPNPVILRPSLSGSKKDAKKVDAGATAKSSGIVSGISYAQKVSGSSDKSKIIEISGSFVTPHPPPSDFGKSRLKSGARMQELFEARWQDDRYGMHIEHIRGSAQGAYLKAIYSVIAPDELFSFGLVGRGMVEVYTTTIEAATKLMLEGIDVGGRHLSPFPVSVKPTRVVFSRVPIRTNQEDLLGFLRRFGKVHGKVRPIPLKLGDGGLGKGVLSTSWEAFISVNQGCVLPPGFNLSAAGSKSYIEVTTEAKCHACHQVGHFVAECPKRTRKAAEIVAKETPAPAEVSMATPLPDAAPTLAGHSGNKEPENNSIETQKPAETGVTPVREGATSSDEEPPIKISAKKRLTKRKSKKPEQVVMAAPAPPAQADSKKRKRSDDVGPPPPSRTLTVGPSDTAARLSESEVMTVDEREGPPLSDYESCGSSLSVGSGFEVVRELSEIPKEKLRSLLDSLNYKKSPDRIWSILKSHLEDPEHILPQLKILQEEARKKRKYNEAARCERLSSKISSIIEERKLEDTLRQ